jgi:hypothetical protein
MTFAAALRQLGRCLPFLHDVESRWTETHLLPAFAWRTDSARARLAWQAYLAGPVSMPVALWPKMRSSLVATFKADHLPGLGDGARRKLAQVLVRSVLFQASWPLTDRAARGLFRACDQPMLRSAAWYLWRIVENTGWREQRDALWRSRLGHLLRDLWPREVDKRNGESWSWLLRMAIALDETFADAVAAIEALPRPAQIENDGIFNELDNSSHPDKPDRIAAVRRLLALPIDRFPGADDEAIARIQTRLASHDR